MLSLMLTHPKEENYMAKGACTLIAHITYPNGRCDPHTTQKKLQFFGKQFLCIEGDMTHKMISYDMWPCKTEKSLLR